MVRVSWPLALFALVCAGIVARRPRLLLPVVVVFGVWLLWNAARSPRR